MAKKKTAKKAPSKAQQIRHLLTTTNLSRAAIAERVGVPPSYVAIIVSQDKKKKAGTKPKRKSQPATPTARQATEARRQLKEKNGDLMNVADILLALADFCRAVADQVIEENPEP